MDRLELKFLFGPEVLEAEQQMPVEQRVAWPADSIILYAYKDNKIIGRVGLMSIKFIEGTWAADEMRGTGLPVRMLRQMEKLILSLGNSHVFSMAADVQPEIKDYLERLDFERVPVTLLAKDLTAKEKAA